MEKQTTKYQLEERTAVFGETVIDLCKGVQHTAVNSQLIMQLVRSATSIGANYAEANNASSRRDFRNKIFIAKKESQETLHWLRMLRSSCPEQRNSIEKLHSECSELLLIFQRITTTLDRGKNGN